MKMRLNICGDKLEDIRDCLKELSEDVLDSNRRGEIGDAEYDYDFIEGDLDSDDNKDTTQPTETKKTIIFEGVPHGDIECFCWEVTEDEYRRVMGEDDYQFELKTRKEREEENKKWAIERGVESWYIYPDYLIDKLKISKRSMRFTLIVNEKE